MLHTECGEVPIMFPNEFLMYKVAKKHIECYHEDHSAASFSR